jgi:hypothetical protein
MIKTILLITAISLPASAQVYREDLYGTYGSVPTQRPGSYNQPVNDDHWSKAKEREQEQQRRDKEAYDSYQQLSPAERMRGAWPRN